MRQSFKNIFLVSAAVTALTSCQKYLEKDPDNRAEINTIQKLAQLVGTAYPSYGYMAMAEVASDNATDKGPDAPSIHTDIPYPNFYFWEDVEATGNNTPTQYWNGVYAGIAAANHALKAIEEQNFGSEANPYKGEALVARAYGHFMLVTFFAKTYEPGGDNSSPGIPYATEPETKALGIYERGTVQQVYDQIEKDLTEGLPLLEGGKWDVPKYHFTPAAGHAFAARFYMFKKEWQKVIDHANKIFPGGDFTGQLRNTTVDAPSLSGEEYQRWFNNSTSKFNLLIREHYSVYQRTSSYGRSRYGLGPKVYTNYLTAANPTGGTWYNRGWTSGTGNYLLYKYFEHFHYTNVVAAIGYPYIMNPLLTTDEAFLNRAEAYAQLDQLDKALTDLNYYASTKISSYNATNHAVTLTKSKNYFKVTDDKEAVIKTVLDFKRRVFMTEGMRWFDILRHKITVVHDKIDNSGITTTVELGPDDNRRMFQIPLEAQRYSNLAPNPR